VIYLPQAAGTGTITLDHSGTTYVLTKDITLDSAGLSIVARISRLT